MGAVIAFCMFSRCSSVAEHMRAANAKKALRSLRSQPAKVGRLPCRQPSICSSPVAHCSMNVSLVQHAFSASGTSGQDVPAVLKADLKLLLPKLAMALYASVSVRVQGAVPFPEVTHGVARNGECPRRGASCYSCLHQPAPACPTCQFVARPTLCRGGNSFPPDGTHVPLPSQNPPGQGAPPGSAGKLHRLRPSQVPGAA